MDAEAQRRAECAAYHSINCECWRDADTRRAEDSKQAAMACYAKWYDSSRSYEDFIQCVADAVAQAVQDERERLLKWPHQCLMESCCIEQGLSDGR